ncbi:MAG: hypothetical protein LC117_10970 [Bacteroidia bacterium]|nr:hypothetical protein [Bacteroidia bacterium]MCZ2278437.1 hypothetical protein [Bacteroidia bacterium]
MDNLSRQFLNTFKQQTIDIKYAVLNYSVSSVNGDSINNLDILIVQPELNRLVKFFSRAEGLDYFRIRSRKFQYDIELVFRDHSEMKIMTKSNLQFNTVCITTPYTVIESVTCKDGFKVPSLPYLFEYHLLDSITRQSDLSQTCVNLVSCCSAEERAQVFSYIVSKYRFVINTLDDLFHYKAKNAKAVMNYYSQQKGNMLLRFISSVVNPFRYRIDLIIAGSWIYYYKEEGNRNDHFPEELLTRTSYFKAG